jgi:flagellar biosynthesis component FlhA
MRTLSKLLLLLAIAVGVPSLPSLALASGASAAVQGRRHRSRHRAHHRERRHEERRHEERNDHPGEL